MLLLLVRNPVFGIIGIGSCHSSISFGIKSNDRFGLNSETTVYSNKKHRGILCGCLGGYVSEWDKRESGGNACAHHVAIEHSILFFRHQYWLDEQAHLINVVPEVGRQF